ncbi:MAG: ABC transporter substrate-binding protein [Candidatus Krumholzibacteria bacterium]
MERRTRTKGMAAIFSFLALLLIFSGSAVQAAEEIRIGLLVPLTGPLAKSGEDSLRGHNLLWEQVGNKVAGRPVRIIVGDEACNPDAGITQARRLVHAEKVHFLVGPLCGHVGKAVAQVSRETGIPVLMAVAGPDEVTKWNRVPTVIRTGFSASQNAHPFGEWLAKEKGCKNTTFIGQDYTFGQENTLGVVDTYKLSGGKVAKLLWTPIGTTDYGPVLAGIPPKTDCVVVTVVGADRNRLFEQWFDFGFNRRFKIYGNYWLLNDVLPEVDDRAIGLISQSLHYAAGIDTPENKKFVNAFAKRYKTVPSYFAENYYSTALWAKTALEAINGKVEDKAAFLKAVREAKIVAPRGPVSLDEYDNPIQNTYISKVVKVKHPILGEVLMNVPIKIYKAVSQFWTWTPKEYLARGPYKR